MQAYNVEIFDRNFKIKDHVTVGDFVHNQDYLSLPDTTITVHGVLDAAGGDYVRIAGGDRVAFGVLQDPTETGRDGEYRFRDFLSVFDTNILFDTSLQGSTTSLEDMIARYIREGWISNSDASQNIPGLRVNVISTTTGWGFHLTSDTEGLAKTIINFYGVILKRALAEYHVGVYVDVDPDSKIITLNIGVKKSLPMFIEADIPNVLNKTVVVNKKAKTVNKVIIYNRQTLANPVIYYLHPDGSYDTRNDDRIVPVVYSMLSIESENFASAAASEAGSIFSTNESNYAELTVLNEDPLAGMELGQQVTIIDGGRMISSVLTGKESGDVTKLIFGTVRLDLTKILKMKGV